MLNYQRVKYLVGGWKILYFPIYLEFHNPNWLVYFSEGLKPPTSIYIYEWDNWRYECCWRRGARPVCESYLFVFLSFFVLVGVGWGGVGGVMTFMYACWATSCYVEVAFLHACTSKLCYVDVTHKGPGRRWWRWRRWWWCWWWWWYDKIR